MASELHGHQCSSAKSHRWGGSEAWNFWGSESTGKALRGLKTSWWVCWCPECLPTSHRWEIQSCSLFPSGHNSHRNLWSGRELLPVFPSGAAAQLPLSLCARHCRHWFISARVLFELGPPGSVHTRENVCKRQLASVTLFLWAGFTNWTYHERGSSIHIQSRRRSCQSAAWIDAAAVGCHRLPRAWQALSLGKQQANVTTISWQDSFNLWHPLPCSLAT